MDKEYTIKTPEDAIDRYADMVYRLAFTQVKNQTDADDIFQEVFLRLVKHIHKLKNDEHVKAWLIRVTINCSKKHFDNYWNKNVVSIEDDSTLSDESEELSYMLHEENPVTLAVKKLPEKYRVIVHLFYYEEFSITEIGNMLKMKESTVKSQLFRAREMLKGMLKED